MLLCRQFIVNFLWKLLLAAVGQVGPDELFLGEAEHTKTAARQGVVKLVSGIGYNFLSLKDPTQEECVSLCCLFVHLSLIRLILGRWMSNQR